MLKKKKRRKVTFVTIPQDSNVNNGFLIILQNELDTVCNKSAID
jgi:hypothetical protein